MRARNRHCIFMRTNRLSCLGFAVVLFQVNTLQPSRRGATEATSLAKVLFGSCQPQKAAAFIWGPVRARVGVLGLSAPGRSFMVAGRRVKLLDQTPASVLNLDRFKWADGKQSLFRYSSLFVA